MRIRELSRVGPAALAVAVTLIVTACGGGGAGDEPSADLAASDDAPGAATRPATPGPGRDSARAPVASADGLFGFPRGAASILADQDDLQLSIFSDADHLYVQAVFWTDGDDATGEAGDGRPIGDRSELRLDVDANLRPTAMLDRVYFLNPEPARPGLHYRVAGGDPMIGPAPDSAGRGSIRYVEMPDGRRVRVDSYLIPLTEIGREPGESIRLAFWAASPSPDLVLNSVGYAAAGTYDSAALPMRLYHEFVLQDYPRTVAPALVPDDRDHAPASDEPPV